MIQLNVRLVLDAGVAVELEVVPGSITSHGEPTVGVSDHGRVVSEGRQVGDGLLLHAARV